ncbi:septation regulator SpoVG [Heliobacterium chlorum]|uniref:Septation regulator SpoVG n=1 Tax=Heliobacterium chlorum TaxID=2698 RepID=A0ABR7T2I8_HELCL|nr:septation regulator SpoVG [Heliobacterium chlorum]
MDISVRIRKIIREGSIKAIASVTIDEMFVIHDIKVIAGKTGDFVAMPSKKVPNGSYLDIVHPIHQEFRDIIFKAVMEEYEKATVSSKTSVAM